MNERIEAALRGGLADSITIGIALYTAYELGRTDGIRHATRRLRDKARASGYAEGMMDAYRGSKN